MIPLDPSIRAPVHREHLDLKERFKTPDLGVKFPLTDEELSAILEKYENIERLSQELKVLSLVEIQRIPQKELSLPVEKIIAIGMDAIKKRFGIELYNTQVFTLLGILDTPEETRGRLAQVKTGEGKSIIVTLLAFVLAIQNKNVDIISSSHYLSIRDQKKYNPFFQGFGITTSHICDEHPKAEDFQARLRYGMAVDFEFAIMRETIHTKKIFSSMQDTFDTVIVDEVDNLMIDTSLNSARIAYPAKDTHQWIYEPIMQFVRDLGPSSPYHIENLKRILSEDGPISSISDEQIKTLLQSAVSALYHKEQDVDYVLKTSPHEKNKMIIQIIDKENTGRICEGMRWSEGLHEFLEIKHDLRPEEETITPISLSHAVFYDKYRGKIFGFSGTLGSEIEREEVNTIYKLNCFDAPVHQGFQRVDHSPEIHLTKDEYAASLISRIKTKIESSRPVLILSPTIKESQEIYTLCKEAEISCQLFNEMQNETPDTIIGNAGAPGQVTITTNNAGRGTDILLDEISQLAGGLHVILTFYPHSQRIEEQALGRSGRQGQKGSSEILLLSDKLKEQGIIIEKEVREKTRYLDYLEIKSLGTTMRVSRAWKTNVENHHLFVLRKFREESIQRQVSLHVTRAESERVVELFVGRFWLSLKEWKKRRLSPPSFERDNLHAKLDKTRKVSHLESEAIHAWVKYFYRPAEKLIIDGDNLDVGRLYEEQEHNWKQTLASS